jgi:hypothetical protein
MSQSVCAPKACSKTTYTPQTPKKLKNTNPNGNNQYKKTKLTQCLTPNMQIRSSFPEQPQKRPYLFHRHTSPGVNLYEAFSSAHSSTSYNTFSSRPSSTAVKIWKQVPLTYYFRVTPPHHTVHPTTSLNSPAKPSKLRSIRQLLL